jgi:hypothetical protein
MEINITILVLALLITRVVYLWVETFSFWLEYRLDMDDNSKYIDAKLFYRSLSSSTVISLLFTPIIFYFSYWGNKS